MDGYSQYHCNADKSMPERPCKIQRDEDSKLLLEGKDKAWVDKSPSGIYFTWKNNNWVVAEGICDEYAKEE